MPRAPRARPAPSVPLRALRPQAQRKRQSLLDAATRMFLELGYEAASINDLIARVGGSKSSVYAHFGSKEALFAAIIDATLSEVLAPLTDLDLRERPLAEGLEFLALKTLEALTSERGVGVQRLVFAEALREPAIGRLYWEHGPARGIEGLSRYLRLRAARGDAVVPDPQPAAEYFWGMLLHRIMLERYCGVSGPPTRAQMAALARRVSADFLAQWAPRPV